MLSWNKRINGFLTKRLKSVLLMRMSSGNRTNRYKRIIDPSNSEDLLKNEVLYGRSVCNIALQASRRAVFRLHLLKSWETSEPNDHRVVETIELANKRGIPTFYKERRKLDKMSYQRPHQGVCLEVGELPYLNLDGHLRENLVLKATETSAAVPLWVLLSGVLDPMNMGAILRSCLYFNVDNVITSGCAPMTPVLSKASSGAAEILQVYSTNDPVILLQYLLENDWDVVGTVAADQETVNKTTETGDICDMRTTKPLLVVFGSEGSGIPDDQLNLCSKLVTIKPQPSNFRRDSREMLLRDLVGNLNVSTATAVILHELMKKRYQRRARDV